MKNKGFTLVEVLVASFIIVLGVTGYVTLQSQYVRSDSKLNLRDIALQLGQAKLDDLRQFTQIEITPGELAYNDIVNNAGGVIPTGNINVTLSANNLNLHTFNRTWTVIDQYYVDTNLDNDPDTWVQAGDANFPNPLPARPGQKMVNVTVAWNNNEGTTESVVLDGNIAPVALGNSYQAKTESGNAKASPQVDYTPGQAPDVISYDLGNGEKIETSKPVPEIDNQGDNTVVQFETIKYIELANQTDKLEQEDFLTVSCSCKLAGVGQGKTPSMTILTNGELDVEKGSTTTKMTGVPFNNQQDTRCTQCCADHHDTAEMINKETYYRSELGVPHGHFKLLANGSFSAASSAGDPYDEICRFKRVDGYFELYPDWQLLDIVEFDDHYLFAGTNLTDYTNYSEGVIEAAITGNAPPSKPSGRDKTLAPGGYQFISRGIYLDRMKSSHLAEVQAKISAGDADWKAITPFYDINLALLSNWASDTPNVATVTQEPIESIIDPNNNYYGTYSRGRVEALADGTADISVSAYGYNAGITGSDPISPFEKVSLKTDDTVTVTVDSKSANEKFFAIIGDVNCLITIGVTQSSCETNNNKKSNYVDLSSITIVESPSQFSCSITIPKGQATPFFSCVNVSENWTGDIVFSLTMGSSTVTMSVEYPNGSVVTNGTLSLTTGLTQSSSQEYSLLIEIIK